MKTACVGVIKIGRDEDWQVAVLMLASPGGDCLGALLLDGSRPEKVWDYQRCEAQGAFVIPRT